MDDKFKAHEIKVSQIQHALKERQKGSDAPLALHYGKGYSNTARSKEYKRNCQGLDFESLNEILLIDPERQMAIAEPRVSMEALVRAALAHRLVPAVVPEFRGITVGGAIMGSAGESSSHQWGCFNDACLSFEILCGNGDLIQTSPHENREIYDAIGGSYGSIGALTAAEIQLVPADSPVYLQYHFFSNPFEAIEKIESLVGRPGAPDFVDGILFEKNRAAVIEGYLHPPSALLPQIPLFSLAPLQAPWFFQHVKQLSEDLKGKSYWEKMEIEDYLFRYDLGAFWVGGYLFRLPFLWQFITQGLLKLPPGDLAGEYLNCKLREPTFLERGLFRPFLYSQPLWALMHKCERWVQNRLVIQDLCIPMNQAKGIGRSIMEDPAIFPIWLCPIKRSKDPQLFAPHCLPQEAADSHLLNFGLYGIPAAYRPISEITKALEQKTSKAGGRKVLYGRSYYTTEEFWNIYPRERYEDLREKTKAPGTWLDITDKVLSE